MPYYRRKSRRHHVWVLLRPWLLGGIGVAALGGLWIWLTQLGPREVGETEDSTETVSRDDAADALRREVEQLRGALEAAQGSEEIALLEDAVAKQRALLDQGATGQAEIRRLNELETELETARAAGLNEQIDALMKRAEAEEDTLATEAIWQEALRLQRQINRSKASAARKNFVREERFEKQLQELETLPLANEVDAAMAQARVELDEQDWPDALAALTSARETQLRINNEFSRSRFASLSRIDEIERELESLDAATFAIEVDEQEAAGDLAVESGDYEAATEAFEKARQTQLRLNREFSRSRFLSSPRVEQLEVKRQTASSLPLLNGIQTESAAIDRLLKRREVGLAVEKITDVAERLEAVFQQLPKSEALDPELRLKLSYLAARTDELRDIQDAIYGQLKPLPGVSERRLMITEFPQELYLKIMRVNPSRNAGRAFPVDSVNWNEAIACSERLSWILARPVRLPTEDEFRVAVGDPNRVELDTSDQTKSQALAEAPANEFGFHHLLGNLDEWLLAGPDTEPGRASVGGGSFRDDESVVRTVPFRPVDRADRARHVGFRVMVEFEPDSN